LSNVIPFRVRPMLATLVREPFDRKGWIYEEKYDGYRLLAYKDGERVRLFSRNAIERSARFPRIVDAMRGLKAKTLVLDGEAVVFDKKRVSRFQLLQQGKGAVTYAVFDCLYKNGKDLRGEPLSTRRAVMEESIGANDVFLPSRSFSGGGLKAFKTASQKGFEGIVAKDLASPYTQGRSHSWLKVKAHKQDEFVIAGFTEPAGSRKYFGALLLGAFQKGKLHFIGKVGTGFDEKGLAALYKKFKPLIRERTELVDPPREKGVTYLAPKLVAQISYQEITAENKLRQPVFLGLRDDKAAKDVRLPGEES
jgi:bifunctional non-homologous end joining protein LigD